MNLATKPTPAVVDSRHAISSWWRIWQVIAMLHGPILIGLFYLMWVSARLMLGRWPRWGGADDPKGIPVTWLIDLVLSLWFMLIPFVVAFAIVRVIQEIQRYDRVARRSLLECLVTVAGLFGAGYFLAANPHHLVTWFMD